MSKSRQIYVVGGSKGYASWMQGTITESMSSADLVVFTGGEDVSPEIYGHEQHPFTSCNPMRDANEIIEWRKAMDMKKLCVGICRGAQFLCVMAGGKLVQHQPNDKFMHRINTFNDLSILVTSTHHQAQYPWGLAEDDFRVLGWTVGQLAYHEGEDKKEMVMGKVPNNTEVEDCHYPHIRALGIQSHPEMIFERPGKDSLAYETIAYYRWLLDSFINDFPNAK